jgi:hypothetical protein
MGRALDDDGRPEGKHQRLRGLQETIESAVYGDDGSRRAHTKVVELSQDWRDSIPREQPSAAGLPEERPQVFDE